MTANNLRRMPYEHLKVVATDPVALELVRRMNRIEACLLNGCSGKTLRLYLGLALDGQIDRNKNIVIN